MKIKRIEGILHELGEFNWIRELKVKEFDISVEFMNLTCLVGIEKERVCVCEWNLTGIMVKLYMQRYVKPSLVVDRWLWVFESLSKVLLWRNVSCVCTIHAMIESFSHLIDNDLNDIIQWNFRYDILSVDIISKWSCDFSSIDVIFECGCDIWV